MAMYGAFAASTLGMKTQIAAFGAISQNITNMNTGGYKSTDVRFSTVLASTYGHNSDIGGVRSVEKSLVRNQGRILSEPDPYNLSINGQGMFLMNTKADGTGDEFFTRDGGFTKKTDGTTSVTVPGGATAVIGKTYLAGKNGHFLMGWEPDAGGVFNTSDQPVALRIDVNAFTSEAAATTTATLGTNLPANDPVGTTRSSRASIFDSNGDERSIGLIWTRAATPSEWSLHIISDLDATPDSNVLGAGTTPNVSAPLTINFDTLGKSSSTTPDTITVDMATDPDVSFTLDLSEVTQLGSEYLYIDFQNDGRKPGTLDNFRFDEFGQVIGRFTNGVERPIYKLPLATVTNPDALEAHAGNLYSATVESGGMILRQINDPAITGAAGSSVGEFAYFVPNTRELSNTDLQKEFTNMILSQQAYNTSAKVFTTVDEMLKTAAGLKT
ncbi:MAG: flagellar hook-basal body complex protein [Rhodospirillales bacterium]|nr:flagellar hook-basal body complex protein [Rhodospirillales bacterium]